MFNNKIIYRRFMCVLGWMMFVGGRSSNSQMPGALATPEKGGEGEANN